MRTTQQLAMNLLQTTFLDTFFPLKIFGSSAQCVYVFSFKVNPNVCMDSLGGSTLCACMCVHVRACVHVCVL